MKKRFDCYELYCIVNIMYMKFEIEHEKSTVTETETETAIS